MRRLSIWATGLLVLSGLVGGGERASADYIPGVFTGTGAYRRVYSDSQYSFMSANIYLPGGSAVHMVGSDTPYVYTGGWGDLNGNGALDAGFQYSPTFNNWSLFEAGVGSGRIDFNGPRLRADQTVSLMFEVYKQGTDTLLTVTAGGVDITGVSVVQSLTLKNVVGWTSGGQHTLKRMTSIAQAGGDRFTDGSFISGVIWSNVLLGQSATNNATWTGGGMQNYPATPGVVNINYVNSANETDAISLVAPPAVPEPSSLAMLAVGQVMGLGYWWRRKRQAGRSTDRA